MESREKWGGENLRAPKGFRVSGPREPIGVGGETMGWKRSRETNAPIIIGNPSPPGFPGPRQ